MGNVGVFFLSCNLSQFVIEPGTEELQKILRLGIAVSKSYEGTVLW